MCGRTGLNLQPEDILRACCYKKRNESGFSKPKWKDESNLNKNYNPSLNIAPTEVTPVLLSPMLSENGNDRIVKPMMWGMVPPWHKGEPTKHGLSTNNCRIENVSSSKLFSPPLERGNRCIVLAEGFYEWKTTDRSKQPYYIYMPQKENLKVFDSTSWKNNFDETDGWNGINLLKMAGIYNTWKCDAGNLFSYSIITMESNNVLNWLHHRMPAILETEDQIEKWLDVKNISHKDALSTLKPATNLVWHPVSNEVNSSRNKSVNCNKPMDSENVQSNRSKIKNVGSTNLMNAWLKRKTPTENEDENVNKKSRSSNN